MAQFRVSFLIDKSRLGDLIEVLTPMRVEELEHKLVVGKDTKTTKVRAGDVPAWQIVAELATDKLQPRAYFTEALRKAGFVNPATGIDQALRKRAVRKATFKGQACLRRGTKS